MNWTPGTIQILGMEFWRNTHRTSDAIHATTAIIVNFGLLFVEQWLDDIPTRCLSSLHRWSWWSPLCTGQHGVSQGTTWSLILGSLGRIVWGFKQKRWCSGRYRLLKSSSCALCLCPPWRDVASLYRGLLHMWGELCEINLLIRWWLVSIVARTITALGSFSSSILFAIAEPIEILCVLDRNIGVLNDDHENVLYDRDQEENETIHEDLCVPEIDFFYRLIGVEKRISGLYREHRIKSSREGPETIFELPCHRHWHEADADIKRKNSNPHLQNSGYGSLESSQNHIKVVCVCQVLCDRAPNTERAEPDQSLSIAQREDIGENFESSSDDQE